MESENLLDKLGLDVDDIVIMDMSQNEAKYSVQLVCGKVISIVSFVRLAINRDLFCKRFGSDRIGQKTDSSDSFMG
ncbi:MAG: hypothetical protein LUF92_16250 [Clostridiales bacterium]|nr:hypothetical protein [Clostridiales bacterium]